MNELPYSEACERNKQPILEVLQHYLKDPIRVLEIGSGTGQHAVFFAEQLPHIQWQPSDQQHYLAGIKGWLEQYPGSNIRPLIELDVRQESWPSDALQATAVFTANTLHIMGWREVQHTFEKVGGLLREEKRFFSYGPFNQDGEYTSDSNRRFDELLRTRDPHSGIRDIRDLSDLAAQHGLHLEKAWPMPANNQLLVWQKTMMA